MYQVLYIIQEFISINHYKYVWYRNKQEELNS